MKKFSEQLQKLDSLNPPSDLMHQFTHQRNKLSGPAEREDRILPSKLFEKRPSFFPILPAESLSFASRNLKEFGTDENRFPISSDKKVDHPAVPLDSVQKFFSSFRTEIRRNVQGRQMLPSTKVAPFRHVETRLPMDRHQSSFGPPVQAKLPSRESRLDVRNPATKPSDPDTNTIAGTVQAREADARRWMTSQKAVEDNTKRTAASAARTVELLEQIKAKEFLQIETG